jgi:peptidoglycan/xylan/chitin deacetylase (PgdA/CDA1 family)
MSHGGNSPPRVVISLDLELRWGMYDKLNLNRDAYRSNLMQAKHEVIPALLKLFRARNIRATWATVGAVACRDWNEYFARAPKSPAYHDPTLQIDDRFAALDPEGHLHFAPELVRNVHATPGQDLGTHTFSHILMREPGVEAEDVRADLEAVAHLWRDRFGAGPVSLVFPRNQVAFLPVAEACGIRIWRGTEPGWYYDANEAKTNRVVPRVLRLLDAVNPLVRHATPALSHMTRASIFLRTNLPAPLWGLHYSRIRNELACLRTPNIYHIWWHPHNLGADTTKRLARVAQVLDLIGEKAQRGQVESKNMRDLCEMPT